MPSTLLSGWLVLALLALAAPAAQAQRQYFNWFFGDSAGISFVGAEPQAQVVFSSRVKFPQGAASMSDGAGRFQFASDGYTVWDRNWQPMPGRHISRPYGAGGHGIRDVLAVPQPGSTSRYYVFGSRRLYYQNQYPAGITSPWYLPYVVVDMTLRNGLGGIAAYDSIRLPARQINTTVPVLGLTGNWAVVRHANGRDLWLVGVAYEGQYLSWLLSDAGLAAQPVLSLQSRWVSNLNGILKASPDGRTLALLTNAQASTGSRGYGRLELAAFNPATGQVSSVQELPTRFKGRRLDNSGGYALPHLAGLELSPDGSRLYADSAGVGPLQYNLLAGSAAAIDASRVQLMPPTGATPLFSSGADLKLGPDGKIYLLYARPALQSMMGVIAQPNVLGRGCELRLGAPSLLPRGASTGTLPLTTNDLNLAPVVVGGAGSIGAATGCASEEIHFTSSLSPFVPAATFSWDFGDPLSGPLNTGGGQAPAHRYQRPGIYTVVVRVVGTNGSQYSASLNVSVEDCTNLPNVITPNGDALNQTLVLKGLYAPDWSIRIYNRWGRQVHTQERYDNSWMAQGQPEGLYYYLLTHATSGQQFKGWVEVLR